MTGASLYARAHGCDLAEAQRVSAAAFDLTGDPALVAAVSVHDLRAFLADVLIANEDLEALIAWLDRPLVADHIRVGAVSGGDIRAGQFRCTAATQRRPYDLH